MSVTLSTTVTNAPLLAYDGFSYMAVEHKYEHLLETEVIYLILVTLHDTVIFMS